MKQIILTLATILLCDCGFFVDENKACSTAQTMGFKNCRVVERFSLFPTWSGCSEGDSAGFRIEADNPTGRHVTTIVCCGLTLKGCTMRTDP